MSSSDVIDQSIPDSDEWPWIKAFSGTWHLRPSGLGYSKDGYRTLCGRIAQSAEVSQADPREIPGERGHICRTCRLARVVT